MITIIDLMDLTADMGIDIEIKFTHSGHRITIRKILPNDILLMDEIILLRHWDDMQKQDWIERLFFRFNEQIQQYTK